jgi:hypothetical protein
MFCVSQCGIAIIILIAQFYMFINCHKMAPIKELIDILDDKQRNIYRKIASERMNIFIKGQIIGVFVSLFILFLSYTNKDSVFKFFNICGTIVLINIISYLYYYLTPKSTFLLEHLDSKEQNTAWCNMYKHMKKCHIIGYLIGIVGYFILLENIL